jgi:hypothetical protein
LKNQDEKVFVNTITKAIRSICTTCFSPELGPLQVLFEEPVLAATHEQKMRKGGRNKF